VQPKDLTAGEITVRLGVTWIGPEIIKRFADELFQSTYREQKIAVRYNEYLNNWYILAVCRSRNISCDIILQNIAQLKSLFKDDWEGIIGNCDTLLYLGGNEYGTYEYLSKILGKETERTKSQSIGKGSRGSSSDSLQTAGRELCMPDEIRRMRDDECLLLMRSEDPVIDKKYNLLHHPNVKYTPDAGGEPYVMPPDYMGDAVTITMDAVAAATAPEITEEMYEQLDYLEKHPEENYYENEENFSQYDQGD